MNLNELRKLAGLPLQESISEDPAINDLIEKTIANLPADRQNKIMDALEQLQNAGRNGLTGQEWMAAYRQIWPKQSEDDKEAGLVLTQAKKLFMGQAIEQVDGKFRWAVGGAANPTGDVEGHPVHGMISAQSAMTAAAKRYAENGQTFTIGNLARVAMSQSGLNHDQSMMAALALINHFPNKFRSAGGNGHYRYIDEPKTDAMSLLRDVANRASQSGQVDRPTSED